MKRFIEYIKENTTESDIKEVVHGVFETIQDMIGSDNEVHEHLATHRNPHELISGIINNMTGSDRELVNRHGLNNPHSIQLIHSVLSDPGYLRRGREEFHSKVAKGYYSGKTVDE